MFDALITDEEGKSSVQLPGSESKFVSDISEAMHRVTSVWALERRNDLPPFKILLPGSEGFDNEFRMWHINGPQSREVPTKSWRLMTSDSYRQRGLGNKIPCLLILPFRRH